jgi:drug/metabolite transporter (DMT)-like permease
MLPSGRLPHMASAGRLLCLASAAAFGAMAIFGKLAYEQGANPATLLGLRFTFAAAMLWCLLLARRELHTVRALPRRDLALALGLGMCGYALQSGCYFVALGRIEASLLALLLYTFPAIVTVAAVLLGRERLGRRRVIALVLVSVGLSFVVAGAGTGALEGVGVALGLGAACVYSTYILVSDGISQRLPSLTLATLVCTGAAVSLLLGSTALGQFRPAALSAAGWGWLVCLAAISTVGAITMFFAGLSRVGPTTASILSTVEPLVTVMLASVVFGERLSPAQLAGGALVLAAVLVLRAQRVADAPSRLASPAAAPPQSAPATT